MNIVLWIIFSVETHGKNQKTKLETISGVYMFCGGVGVIVELTKKEVR